MGVTDRLASEVGTSKQGIIYTSGKLHIQNMCVGPSATDYSQVGDANTALLASKTIYSVVGRVPKTGKVTRVIIRSEAAGVAGATIDILKAASGTAISSGTAVVTQIAGNAITSATDYTMTVVTTDASNVTAGSLIVCKIVGGGGETLKPLFVDVEITL